MIQQMTVNYEEEDRFPGRNRRTVIGAPGALPEERRVEGHVPPPCSSAT